MYTAVTLEVTKEFRLPKITSIYEIIHQKYRKNKSKQNKKEIKYHY